MDTLNQILFIGICFFILLRFYWLALRNTPWKGLLSALACILYIFCLYGSALMQVAGLSSTKLLGPHILPPAQAYELGGLAGKWAIELCVILLGEVMAGFLVPQRNPLISQRSISRASGEFNFVMRNAALALIVVGSISTLAFHSDLSSRADGGQGVVTILKTCLAVGLCVFAFHNFFNQRIYYLVSACGMILLVTGAVRSPVLSVALAFFAGKIARGEVTAAMLMRYAVYGLVLAVVGGAMSNFRGDVVSGRGLIFIPRLRSRSKTLLPPYMGEVSIRLMAIAWHNSSSLTNRLVLRIFLWPSRLLSLALSGPTSQRI
ncbi:hypothetical protein [Agrobacterium tumefaciens]|uniref:hypothetical protein n=1 Tax=Agrobacterium tumefaciens TaxID=358 RepID=UPI0039A4B2BF